MIALNKTDIKNYRVCYYELLAEIEALKQQRKEIRKQASEQLQHINSLINQKKRAALVYDGAITRLAFTDDLIKEL